MAAGARERSSSTTLIFYLNLPIQSGAAGVLRALLLKGFNFQRTLRDAFGTKTRFA